MNDCDIIKQMHERIQAGESADSVIPYNMNGFSKDIYKEALLLYIKYGSNAERLAFCKNRYKEC